MNSIIEFLQSIPIMNWSLLAIMIFFAILGFWRGGAKIIIHSLWWVFGAIIATLLYEPLTHLNLFTFIATDNKSLLFINFIAIFTGFMLLKLVTYNLLATIAKIHGPCPLNRFVALLVGFGFAIVLSWYIARDIASLEIAYRIITNDLLRIILMFLTIFTIIIILAMSVAKLLNIKVGIDRPCPLLVFLQPLDGILNAKNINSVFNNIEGIIFSIIQGFVLLIILIIINNHFNFINIEYSGFFATIKDNADFIQNVLSDYLLFINKI